MAKRTDLGDFLRSRRARLQPHDVGLRTFVGTRRVPGLRREELAQLAGLSADYYVRVEQGRTPNVSDTVLDAIARALQLNVAEHAHLRNLARPSRVDGLKPLPNPVRPELERLLHALDRSPAYVVGLSSEILAWNRMAAALLVDFAALAPEERNWARLVFLDGDVASRFVDWEAKARDCVGHLRLSAGRHPDDADLTALIGELSARSEPFRELWAVHDVKEKAHGTKAIRHPLVGELQLDFQTVRLPDEPEQALVIYTAATGSPDEASLHLLGSWTVESTRAGHTEASDRSSRQREPSWPHASDVQT